MKLEQAIKQKRFRSPYEKLIVNILFTSAWLNGVHGRRLKAFGLTWQQYNVLRILRGQHPSPATINLLKDRMLDKMSNASRLVEKLRLKGLAERNSCASDRRAVDVKITPAGLDLLAEIDAVSGEWETEFHALDTREADRLNDLLDKLRG